MSKLDRIEIINFKSIRELNLELHPLNVFIGPNGVGKSNFIGVFKFLNQLIEGNLQSFTRKSGGANNLLHFGRKQSENMSFSLYFYFGDVTYGYKCTLAAGAEDNLYFDNEEILWHENTFFHRPSDCFMGKGHLETRLKQTQSRLVTYVYDHLQGWNLYHFHDTSKSAGMKQTCDLEDNRILKPDASNLAAFLYRLQETNSEHFEKIQDAVRMVGPFFDRFTLEPSRLNPEKIRLEWKEKGSDAYFNGSALSDGSLRFICLAALLLQPSLPSVILLDEPELGLHPYAVAVLADLLRAASKQTQVLVATQSVTLVNQFDPEQVVVVEREEDHSIFRHLDRESMQDWLEDYGLGDLWEKNLLGGRP